MNSPAGATGMGFERVVQALAEAARMVEERFVHAARAWERPHGASGAATGDALARQLELGEVAAIEWLLARGADEADRVIAALRIANDLRRIDQLVSQVALRLPHPLPRLPDDTLAQLHHLTDLTLTQLSVSRDCLHATRREQVQRVLEGERFLDDWYDILLGDILDELAGDRMRKADLMPVLTLARALERIGDQARNIAENALVISR